MPPNLTTRQGSELIGIFTWVQKREAGSSGGFGGGSVGGGHFWDIHPWLYTALTLEETETESVASATGGDWRNCHRS